MSRKRLPLWLRRAIPNSGLKETVQGVLRDTSLSTVCEEARCPNRAECYGKGTATFLLMGDVCTRNCRFCSVVSGTPLSLSTHEAQNICEAVSQMGLRYVVLTSVTRDDLADGGSGHVAQVVRLLKQRQPEVKVEALVPDFLGDTSSVDCVLKSGIDVFNHNVEMVERLYTTLRPQARYKRSLELLSYVKSVSLLPVKTGFMVGLGEDSEEVYALLDDLAESGVDIVTIGQYLQPTAEQIVVDRFVTPEEFGAYKKYGEERGIALIEAGPFVRSSYNASKIVEII